jgi:hypothetical protein
MKVPDDRLRKVLGIRQVNVAQTPGPLAIIDSALG